eukprot:6199113-Pleurochrysis_carterae.AAC.1
MALNSEPLSAKTKIDAGLCEHSIGQWMYSRSDGAALSQMCAIHESFPRRKDAYGLAKWRTRRPSRFRFKGLGCCHDAYLDSFLGFHQSTKATLAAYPDPCGRSDFMISLCERQRRSPKGDLLCVAEM